MLKRMYEAMWRTRWRLVEAALSPRRDVVCRGLRFSLPADNWITRYRWQSYNTKEVETLDWIDKAFQNDDTLFDIGANIGQYSIYAALRHPGIHVVAFEPEYSNAPLFKRQRHPQWARKPDRNLFHCTEQSLWHQPPSSSGFDAGCGAVD
jgi:hypothetical protein